MGPDPSVPSRGLRSDATRPRALRLAVGPLLELRGAPGTQVRCRLDGHGFRPTRTAFRRPPGMLGSGPPEPACAGRGPPLRFRSPSKVHRDTPAPSRRSEDRLAGRCFLSWAFAPYDTCGKEDPRFAGLPAPRRAASGFGTRITASTSLPPGTRRSRSVHGLLPSRLRSTRRSVALSGPMPSCRCPRRFASLPGSVRTRSTSRPRSRRAAACRRTPCGTRRTRAFLGFVPPERSLPPSWPPRWIRGASLLTHSAA